MTDDKKAQILAAFGKAINMTHAELAESPDTPESLQVGYKKPGANKSVGHASGCRILSIMRSAKALLRDDDYKHMQKVVGFVARILLEGRRTR